jgi:hypothetical protein
MQTNRGEDGHYADCLKSKAESPINGSLAFLLEKVGDKCRYACKLNLLNLEGSALLQPN